MSEAIAAAFATVTLDSPLARGETSITTVQVRKPAAGELRGLKLVDVVHVDVNAMMLLLPRITNPVLTSIELQAMDLSDFLALADRVANFLPQKGESTGSPSA